MREAFGDDLAHKGVDESRTQFACVEIYTFNISGGFWLAGSIVVSRATG